MISQVITFEQATRDQVIELAREWPAAYVECRMDRHEWRPSTARHYPGFRYFHVIKICHRCRTEKHQEIGEAGQLFASTYRYPTGYLTNGRGRIIGDARDALRLESIKRSFKITTVDELGPNELPYAGTRRGLGMTNGH
jgi:hypothetical protein